MTATLLSEVCHDVATEPTLQPISGEVLEGATANSQDGARLDIAASGFWGGQFERSYFDVRVFNPHAASNRQTQLSSTYRRHENVKRRAYEQRIREVEHASFTPLVMSLTGGLGHAATITYKRLGSLLAEKWDTPLCYCHGVATLPPLLLAPTLLNTMYPWCTLHQRSRCLLNHPLCGPSFQGGCNFKLVLLVYH